MPHIKKIPFNFLVALDQMLNTLCGGWPDETLSSRAARLQHKSKAWGMTRKAIDALFFWQPGHCAAAYQSEVARNHLPPQQRQESGE